MSDFRKLAHRCSQLLDDDHAAGDANVGDGCGNDDEDDDDGDDENEDDDENDDENDDDHFF